MASVRGCICFANKVQYRIQNSVNGIQRRAFAWRARKNVVYFNPFSGKAQIKSKLFEIIDVFVKGGYEVIVHPTQAVGDGFEKTKELAPQVDLVVCSGATEHWMKLSAV